MLALRIVGLLGCVLESMDPDCAVSPLSSLSISIVLYCTDRQVLADCLSSLIQAVNYALQNHLVGRVVLVFVDNNSNSYTRNTIALLPEAKQTPFCKIECISGHGNIGYGRGHNLAIQHCDSDYHLVLNPDVVLADDAICAAVDFMRQHPQAGLLAPAVRGPDGKYEYLCKRYPAVTDLLLRGFAPNWLRRLAQRRLARYEMRDLINAEPVWDVPLVSGCFMFLRGSVVRRLKGFDPAYFLYFEDYDLSIRLATIARTVYVPTVNIVHYGGHAARKGWRHIVMFVQAALRFYGTHGWRFI